MDDCGIEEFTESTIEYIVENCMNKSWFDEAMRESFEFYVDDIRHESSSDKEYENRLEEEMTEANCEDEYDYVDHLCSQYEDGVE